MVVKRVAPAGTLEYQENPLEFKQSLFVVP